jgi:hypothetical protein
LSLRSFISEVQATPERDARREILSAMMRAAAVSVTLLFLTGCIGSNSSTSGQRFVLLPDTSGIAQNIPAGALALDTRTGQVCFTTSGSFTAAAPQIMPCKSLLASSKGD